MRAGSINIFEGGRRIRDLILWLIGLVTAGLISFGGGSTIILERPFPDNPWSFSKNDCEYSDHAEYLGMLDLTKLGSRYVTLCFRKQQYGFPYEMLDKDEMPPPLVKTVTPPRDGSPVIPSPPMKYYNFNVKNATEVQAYFKKSTSNFTLKDANLAISEAGMWSIRFSDFKTRVKDNGVPGFAIFIAIWIITAALGWVVRGFAGIPVGQDFRKSSE